MVASDHTAGAPFVEREFPPIAWIGIGSMALVIIGGVYTASYVPKNVSLVLPIVLLIGAALLLAVNVVLLSLLHEFAWTTFRQVFQYALLAYLVIAGMIAYVFVVDGTPGRVLAVLLGMLAVFAVDVPTILAFSVARYQDPD